MGQATQDRLVPPVSVGGELIPGVEGSTGLAQGHCWARGGGVGGGVACLQKCPSGLASIKRKCICMLEVGEFQAQLPFSKGDLPAEEATGDKHLQRFSLH